MREYTITSVQRRDEWQGRFGPMVTFAIALQGEDGWHKLNQKLATPEPKEGDKLTGTISTEKHGGESYKKFTKVNPGYENRPSQPQQQSLAPSNEAYIIQMLEELTGRRSVADTVQNPTDEQLDDPFKDI